MYMKNDKPKTEIKAACSVTEMAHQLNLSRARFYQLVKDDIFPPPVYCLRTKRPFYPPALQIVCVRVRATGIGANGQIILFYRPRSKTDRPDPHMQLYNEIHDIFQQTGINKSKVTIKKALEKLYPQGLPARIDTGTLAGELFRYFQ